MRIKKIGFFFLFSILIISGGSGIKLTSSEDIYLMGLQLHLNGINATHRQNGNSTISSISIRFDDVTKDFTHPLPNYAIEYLDGEQILNKLKEKSASPLFLLVIKPFNIDGDTLSFDIVHYGVNRRGRVLNYINTGGGNYKFKFDCDLKEFRFQESLDFGW